MIKKTLFITLFILPFVGKNEGSFLLAQRPANASMTTHRNVIDAVPLMFKASTEIAECNIPEAPLNWGMDTAWNSADNVTRGTNFIGTDILNIGRVSFQPSDLVDADGNLSSAQKQALQSRLNNISISGVKDIILNCDHEALISENYYGKPTEWYKVIKASVKYVQSKGFNVITVSPFNEPDLAKWGEGTKAHFKSIAKLISEDEELNGIRISAGNTLNCDEALSWYNYMKPYVTEGNTHQLAGSLANYAAFWQTVRNDGNHATADELHNVGEAFVGAHYGMQSGVWWGWDGAARGEYCKASVYGKEIGYAENRNAWTAATVYKRKDGRTDAFIGSSERQAYTSTFEFVTLDRPAYYDGYGPVYNYSMTIPGGTGYQTGQSNSERMILIHYGEDVPLDVPTGGTYAIMNIHSSMCLGYYNGAASDGLNITQMAYTSSAATHQQWNVVAISDTLLGDYSYFYLQSVRNPKHFMDIKDWSLSAGANIIGWPGEQGSNEQWFVEYAGKGNWYIRSRHSGLYLEIKDASTARNGQLIQGVYTGAANQQWRFIPVKAKLEQKAPAAPQGLNAEVLSASVKLSWQANSENDIAGYVVLRALADADPTNPQSWDMIGRMITTTEFIDNSALGGVEYMYKVKAVDKTRNQSEASAVITAKQNDNTDGTYLVANYNFEDSTFDETENILDAVVVGKALYSAEAKQGTSSFNLSENYLVLPSTIADRKEMTISMWANIGTNDATWQRLFDFGNGTSQYFFLTPNNGSQMRVVLKNKGTEQILSAPTPSTGWHHFTVTLSTDSIRLYMDGELVAGTTEINIRPADFTPRRNYIGRSQYVADPLFVGQVDDIRIYNTAISAEQVKDVMLGNQLSTVSSITTNSGVDTDKVWLLDGRQATGNEPSGTIYIKNGKKTIK